MSAGESGRTLCLVDKCGLKFGRGSSDYSLVAAVVSSGDFSAGGFDQAIDEPGRELHKPSSIELHFSRFGKNTSVVS
jgi:hypothetical protein